MSLDLLNTFNCSEDLVDTVIKLENYELQDKALLHLLVNTNNNDIKCWVLLKLKWIETDFHSDYLVNLLLNNDSRLRELASEVICNHILSNDPTKTALFDKTNYYETYALTLTDVNPRVTRNISDFFTNLSEPTLLFELLIARINDLQGPYELYWVLECIGNILQKIDSNIFDKHELFLTEALFKVVLSNDKFTKDKLSMLLVDKGKNIFSKDPRTINFIKSKIKEEESSS